MIVTHSIRQLSFDIDVPSEALALSLQPRLGELNRRRFLPLIEQVLDEFDRPGRHIRIERLDLDLGKLPLDGFEDALVEALEAALREALTHETLPEPARAFSADAARLDLLEHYLVRGTLPFWARPGDFAFDRLLVDHARGDRAAVRSIVRRHTDDRRVLERIVRQLAPAALRELLHLLEPAHAALILAYMADLGELHRLEPLVALGDAAFARLLWLIVLSYVAREAGSQFNRRSFVRSLLEQLAASEGLDYADLLGTLERALFWTVARRPLASSLPAVIGELLAERPVAATDSLDDPGEDGRLAQFADALAHGRAPAGGAFAALVLDLMAAAPDALVRLVRRHGHARHAIELLVEHLRPSVLADLLALLEPEHAGLIIAYMADLGEIHRVEPLVALGEAAFDRLLWRLVLSYVVREAGSQFNRKSFVRTLLTDLATDETIDYTDLLATLRSGLAATASHRTLASSLPAIIRELAEDVAIPAIADSGLDALAVAAAQLSALAHYLTRGIGGETLQDIDGLIEFLAMADPAGLAQLIRRHGHRTMVLERLVTRRARPMLDRLLQVLTPDHAATIIDYMIELAVRMRDGALLSLNEDGFMALLWILVLRHTVREAGSHFNRKSFLRSLLEGLATEQRIGYRPLVQLLAHGLGGPGGPRPPDTSLPALLRELADDLSQQTPDRLGETALTARFDRIAALRLYLRDGILPAGDESVVLARLASVWFELSAAELRALLATDAGAADPAAIRLMLALVPPDRVADLLAPLLPEADRQARTVEVQVRTIAALVAERAQSPTHWHDATNHHDAAPLSPLRAAVRDGDPSAAAMLVALLAERPALAQDLAEAIEADPGLRQALVARIPADVLAPVLAALRPADAASLERMLAALDLPSRVTLDQARRRLLDRMLMRRWPAPPPAELLAALLRALFDDVETPARGEALRRQAAAWRRDGLLPVPLLAALDAAIEILHPSEATGPAAAQARMLETAVLALLRGEPLPAGLSFALALRALRDGLADGDGALAATVRLLAADQRLRTHWAATLPDEILIRLVLTLEPDRPHRLLDTAETLARAWRELAPAGRRLPANQSLPWNFILDYLVRPRGAFRSVDRLVEEFVVHVAGDDVTLSARVAERAGQLAQSAGRSSLARLLDRPKAAPAKDRQAKRPLKSRTAFEFDRSAEAGDGEQLYIDNAGLVLTNSFLPMLFERLGLLRRDEAGRTGWRDADAAARAVHLSQYLVDGRSNTPEPRLTLNKILCGIPLSVPIVRAIELDAAEAENADMLLQSMLANWPALKGTSIAGLQETFLQRDGRLQRIDGAWKLFVPRKTVDVLVDMIPWSIAILYHPWMPEPIHVTW